MLGLVRQTFSEFFADDCPTSAAALSYYIAFALPSVLVLTITLVGVFVDPADFTTRIQAQISALMGAEAAREIGSMIEHASARTEGRFLQVILGVAALVFGATGAFLQLQKALNTAWDVRPEPGGGIRGFFLKRLLSLGMIFGVAFLLLVSLLISALLTAFGDALGALLPGVLSAAVLKVLQFVISLVVITVLFGAIFKVLPDAIIGWRDVAVGAVVTALLFVVGKFGIGFYLGQSDPGSAFGAAGALAILLIWIYYSAMLLLLGAEFTQVWARRHGRGLQPEPGAIRLTEPSTSQA